MPKSRSTTGKLQALLSGAKRHKQLLITMSVLSIFAVGGQILLRADLTANTTPTAAVSSSVPSFDARACSSDRTMFSGMRKPKEIIALFRRTVNEVVEEREQIFQHPSRWRCNVGAKVEIPKLQALAQKLPGWNFVVVSGASLTPQVVQRTVDWQSFAAVLAEYLREYECKMAELEASSAVLEPTDFGFSSKESEDYMERMSRAEWAARMFYENRIHARLAIERTIQALKSAEQHFQLTKDLVCLQRTTMDIQAEMTLLADTVSCLPKIWDAAMSIHDRKSSNYSQ